MSAEVPIIAEWIKKGLRWTNLFNPILKPIKIPPNGAMVQLPYSDYTFKYPEGVVLYAGGAFDSPHVGTRFESKNLDTKTSITIRNVLLGGVTLPNMSSFARIPPNTPPGIYSLDVLSKWAWHEWMRAHIFNLDSVEHTCLSLIYHIAVLEPGQKKSSEE